MVSRSGYTGEDGFEILVPTLAAPASPMGPSPSLPGRSVSARAIRCGSKPVCRSTAMTSTPGHAPEAGLAFAIYKRRRAEGGFPGAPRVLAELRNGAPQKRVGLNVRPPPGPRGRADARRRRHGGRQGHQRRLFALARRPIAMGYVAPPTRRTWHPAEARAAGQARRRPVSPCRSPPTAITARAA